MFILMKYSKMEGTRTRTNAHRVGLFRTRRGANKVMARLEEIEKKKPPFWEAPSFGSGRVWS